VKRGRGIAIGFKACVSPTTSLAAVSIMPTAAARVLQHRRHGAGLGHRDGADRRRSAQHGGRVRDGGALRHRRHAVRHGDRSARARSSTWATR
jgi:hypothetical protein